VTAETVDLHGAHGVFGGTFDPIHLAHLAVAEAARDDLGLADVTFIPAGQPPHKADRVISPATDRAAMVAAAIADHQDFHLSTIELERDGPSYTVDTLAALASAGIGQLALIISMDSFVGLPTWREPERVLELATVVVAPRDGFDDAPDDFLATAMPGVAARVVRLAGPHLRMSASEVRRRAAAGRSIRYLVPDAVAAYIGDHALYRTPSIATHEPRRPDRS